MLDPPPRLRYIGPMHTSWRPAPASLIILLLALSAIPACTVYRDPVVSVVDVAVTETGEGLVGLGFTLVLENPNPQPLALHEFSYTLAIDGAPAYRGRWAASATLGANGTRRLTIPAIVRYDQLGWTASSAPSQATYDLVGHVLYLAPGDIAEILFDTGVRRPKAAFAAHGVVNLTARNGPANAQAR